MNNDIVKKKRFNWYTSGFVTKVIKALKSKPEYKREGKKRKGDERKKERKIAIVEM